VLLILDESRLTIGDDADFTLGFSQSPANRYL